MTHLLKWFANKIFGVYYGVYQGFRDIIRCCDVMRRWTAVGLGCRNYCTCVLIHVELSVKLVGVHLSGKTTSVIRSLETLPGIYLNAVWLLGNASHYQNNLQLKIRNMGRIVFVATRNYNLLFRPIALTIHLLINYRVGI